MAKVVGDPKVISVSGKVLAFKNNQPVIIELPREGDYKWVVIFDNPEMLHQSMQELKIIDYTVKVIENGLDFIESVYESGLRVMLNPYVTNEGKTRWTEIIND